MITREIQASNLQDYYEKLCELQTNRHGEKYIDVHKEIVNCLRECSSYTEFGIMQGTTLAAALLEKPKQVRAYDIDLGWYNKGKQHFEQFAEQNEIGFRVFETNTADCSIEQVEVLYIDSCHTAKHLTKELSLHADKVSKYIVLHDTSHKPELFKAAQKFCSNNPWKIKTHNTNNVGFTTMERT